MSSFFALLAFVMFGLGCIYAGVSLVDGGHYGWAWIPFLIASSLSLKTNG